MNNNGKSYIIRGKYNEILSDNIGENTVISGWTFIGKNVKIGKNCRFSNFVNIDEGCNIGNNVNLQVYVVLNRNTQVGDNVILGGHTTTIDVKYLSPFETDVVRKPVKIESNVLVGAGSKLVSSIIGKNSVIGTGSLVLSDIPPNQVWAGSPAKPIQIKDENGLQLIMSRDDFDKKRNIEPKKTD